MSVKPLDVGFAFFGKTQDNLLKFSKMVRAKKSFSQQRVGHFAPEWREKWKSEIRVKAGGQAELVLHGLKVHEHQAACGGGHPQPGWTTSVVNDVAAAWQVVVKAVCGVLVRARQPLVLNLTHKTCKLQNFERLGALAKVRQVQTYGKTKLGWRRSDQLCTGPQLACGKQILNLDADAGPA